MKVLKQWKWIWVSIFAAFVLGCATQSHIGAPIINPAERLELNGVSVLPPQDENWVLGGSPFFDDVAVFKKKLSDASGILELHSYLAVVNRTSLERALTNSQDLLSYVNAKLKVMEIRFQMTTNAALDEARSNAMGTDCVRYDITGKEFNNPNFPEIIFNMNVHGFECRHPSSPEAVIAAYCTERYPEGYQSVSAALKNECRAFLDNVQFN